MRATFFKKISIPLCVLLFGFALSASSQERQNPPLVIEGGTLIDGNGGAPVTDAVIIILGPCMKIRTAQTRATPHFPITIRNGSSDFIICTFEC